MEKGATSSRMRNYDARGSLTRFKGVQKKVEVIRACSGRMWQSAHGGDTGESILMVQNPDIICIHVNTIVWLCQAVRTSVLNSLNL